MQHLFWVGHPACFGTAAGCSADIPASKSGNPLQAKADALGLFLPDFRISCCTLSAHRLSLTSGGFSFAPGPLGPVKPQRQAKCSAGLLELLDSLT